MTLKEESNPSGNLHASKSIGMRFLQPIKNSEKAKNMKKSDLLPENPSPFDYFHAIRAAAARNLDHKLIYELADEGMNIASAGFRSEVGINIEENPNCSCRKCNPNLMRMILCKVCGNKRCPHASDHGFKCTHSNEPNQKGEPY